MSSRSHLRRVLAVAGLLTAACADAPVDGGEPQEVGERAARPRGVYVVVSPSRLASDTEDSFVPKTARRTIFVNRNGGQYLPGWDDSSSNHSSIVGWSSRVDAWERSDGEWQQLMDCLHRQFDRYDVNLTDQDPGDIPHVECVVGGTADQAGMGQGVGGVAPMNGDCSPIEQAVVYAFSKVLGDVEDVCWAAAQEIAHAYGLDHEYLCGDPMTYLSGCGPKDFQDVDAQCGEDGPRQCMCGGATQNSVQMLTQVLGARQVGQPEPPADEWPPADEPPVGDDGENPPQDDGWEDPPAEDDGWVDEPPPGGDEPPPAGGLIANITPTDGDSLPANSDLQIEVRTSAGAVAETVQLLWHFKGVTTVDFAAPPAGVSTRGGAGTYVFGFRVGRGPRLFQIRVVDQQGMEETTPVMRVDFVGGGAAPEDPAGGGLASDAALAMESPRPGAQVQAGTLLPVRARISGEEPITRVALAWEGGATPWEGWMTPMSPGLFGVDLSISSAIPAGTQRTLRLTGYDAGGRAIEGDVVSVTVVP